MKTNEEIYHKLEKTLCDFKNKRIGYSQAIDAINQLKEDQMKEAIRKALPQDYKLLTHKQFNAQFIKALKERGINL